ATGQVAPSGQGYAAPSGQGYAAPQAAPVYGAGQHTYQAAKPAATIASVPAEMTPAIAGDEAPPAPEVKETSGLLLPAPSGNRAERFRGTCKNLVSRYVDSLLYRIESFRPADDSGSHGSRESGKTPLPSVRTPVPRRSPHPRAA